MRRGLGTELRAPAGLASSWRGLTEPPSVTRPGDISHTAGRTANSSRMAPHVPLALARSSRAMTIAEWFAPFTQCLRLTQRLRLTQCLRRWAAAARHSAAQVAALAPRTQVITGWARPVTAREVRRYDPRPRARHEHGGIGWRVSRGPGDHDLSRLFDDTGGQAQKQAHAKNGQRTRTFHRVFLGLFERPARRADQDVMSQKAAKLLSRLRAPPDRAARGVKPQTRVERVLPPRQPERHCAACA